MGLLQRCHGVLLLLLHERREVSLLRLPVLLEVLHPAVVGLDLLLEDDVLDLGRGLVELEGADAVKAFDVKVPAPSNADAVEDERSLDVDLEFEDRIFF